ncbi:hypothetical protein [Asticcacaulis sp. YBE204]|uniref:hypothetical protein n=1 Tax=Asticcacaulis sp. YBE204 TaxID=1282363 RepID=UPI0003C3DDBF|nr:hypothetical protein [Asticcacaulis sp. YBE204]ESQ80855.1 hypothetical protein AEYBE204_00610 [Asticcacaulis sp. YBE204]
MPQNHHISKPTWLAWSPVFIMVMATFIHIGLPDTLTCAFINEDGRETVCGYAYSHPFVRVSLLATRIVSFILWGWTAVLAGKKKLSTAGWIGFITSSLLVLAELLLYLALPEEDAP